MSFDEEYYIARRPADEGQLYLKPDAKTFNRRYGYTKLTQGEAPLFFENAFKDKDKKSGKKRSLTNVLIDSPNLLVDNEARDKLKFLEIDGLQIYPAVYIDDDIKWHENYWFLNFYKELDCWDRKLSVVEIDDDDDDDDDIDLDAEIIKYRLNSDILSQIPKEHRLMFKMGGATKAYIFVHQDVVDIFTNVNATGVRFFKVSEFEEGDQF